MKHGAKYMGEREQDRLNVSINVINLVLSR